MLVKSKNENLSLRDSPKIFMSGTRITTLKNNFFNKQISKKLEKL